MTALLVSPQVMLQNKHTLMYNTIELFQDYLPRITIIVKTSLFELIPVATFRFIDYISPLSKITKIIVVTFKAFMLLGTCMIVFDKVIMKSYGAFKIDDLNSNAALKRKVINEFNKLNPSIDFDQSIQQLKIEKEKIEKKFHLKNIDLYISVDKNNSAFACKQAICLSLGFIPSTKEKNDRHVYVLSHELAHIKHKHYLKALLLDSILNIASLAANIFLPSYIWIGLPLLNATVNLCYTRKHELEADLTAARSMGKSEFIEVIKKYFIQIHQDRRKSYNPDHNPSFMQRVITYISPGSLWHETDEQGNLRKDTDHPKPTDVIKAINNEK